MATLPNPGVRIVVNWWACICCALYFASLLAYIPVRVTDILKYMDFKHAVYSFIILGVEIVGAFGLIPYAMMNCRHVQPEDGPVVCDSEKMYHVFIVVPCYKEDWSTIERTLRHAHAARLPPGCTRHIILLDDGPTPERADKLRRLQNVLYNAYKCGALTSTPAGVLPKWFHCMHHSRRIKTRADGSRMAGNGKSLNLNYCVRYVIPHLLANMTMLMGPLRHDMLEVPRAKDMGLPSPSAWHTTPVTMPSPSQLQNCVLVVLDCDMSINIDNNEYDKWVNPAEYEPPETDDHFGFLPKVLRPLMANPELGTVLTPQYFTNVDLYADVFNHLNDQFWYYILPGLSAMNYVACTGTNMALRLSYLWEISPKNYPPLIGFPNTDDASTYERRMTAPFPTYSVTEDYALSLRLKKRGVKGTYLAETLVSGEAPEGIPKIDIQRGRWTEGHWQIFFSWRNPFFSLRRLGIFQALLYNYGTLAYLCNILTIWVYHFVPLLSVLGLYPVYMSKQFIATASVYLASIFLVQYYIFHGKHRFCMWLANMSNILLSFTYLKAILRGARHNTEFAVHTTAPAAVTQPPPPLLSEVKDVEAGPKDQTSFRTNTSRTLVVSPSFAAGPRRPENFEPPKQNLVRTDKDQILGHLLYFMILILVSFVTILLGANGMRQEGKVVARLLLPMFWAGYNMVGPILFFVASFAKTTAGLSTAASSLSVSHTLFAMLAVVSLWFINSSLVIQKQ